MGCRLNLQLLLSFLIGSSYRCQVSHHVQTWYWRITWLFTLASWLVSAHLHKQCLDLFNQQLCGWICQYLNSLSGLGRSVESCVLLNPPATSGLSSVLMDFAPIWVVEFAFSVQSVTTVLTDRDMLSLERRDAWNERKTNEIYFAVCFCFYRDWNILWKYTPIQRRPNKTYFLRWVAD